MTSNHDFNLTNEQSAAVNSPARATVVLASAGSGKTEVAARRIEELLAASENADFRVLALSYTQKAADELATRLRERVGAAQRRVDSDTIHGFAHSLLRQHGTLIGLPAEIETITRDEDRAELLRRWLEDQGEVEAVDALATLREIDVLRARGVVTPDVESWNTALASSGALDYPAMIDRAIELLQRRAVARQVRRLYGQVIVDEAQNLTESQYRLLTALWGDPGSDDFVPTALFGDDKQSIVSFAGADPNLMLRFASEVGAEVSRLTVNLRSAASIASFAERVAGALGHRDDPGRPQRSYAAKGEVRLEEWPDEVAEAIGVVEWLQVLLADGMPRSALAPHESVQVQPENLAVLARSAAALGAVRDELSRAGLPFSISSGPDEWLATTAARVVIELIALNNADSHRSTHWQIARLLGRQEDTTSSVSDVRHALADHADASLRMIAPLCDAKTPADMMADLDRLSDLSGGDEAWLPAWEADCRQLASAWKAFVDNVDLASQTWGNFRLHIARIQRGDDHQPGVRLLTIHKAQGREYRAVALVGLNEGQFPDFRAISEEEAAAELRTFYVAISRATRVLLLSRARQRQTRVGPRATEPSRFLRYLSHR